MKRTHLVLIIFSVVTLLIVAGSAAWPATAEPHEDTLSYMPYVSSPPVVPVDQYNTGFDAGIEPWTAVRWNNGSDFDVKHNSGCNDGRCGFLDLPVFSKQSYVIASPRIAGPQRSYNIIFRAKLNNRKDKHQYGAIFSADATGKPCPGDNNSSCFNRYYEFLVRYRNDGEEYLQYRIRRIDGHDENNVAYGDVLVDWTRAEGAKATEWTKWEINFRSSGHIYIRANNQDQPAYARDNKFTDQRYFGLITRSNENSNAYVLFDKYEIFKD